VSAVASRERLQAAEEADDLRQPAVGAERADVHALEHDGTVRADQLPAEADVPVVHVDRGRAAEAMAGELALERVREAADAGVALAGGGRVDQPAVLRPRRR
jgi:hypothetical protein